MISENTNNYYILLGTNLGEKEANLSSARTNIQNNIGNILRASAIYETEPWGKREQGAFLNQVVHLESLHGPDKTLTLCLEIEKNMGRIRCEKWMERIIDIDILYWNDLVMETNELVIPHPEIQNRRFTLVPLVEIAPDYIHPKLDRTNRHLLDSCVDPLAVKKLTTNH